MQNNTQPSEPTNPPVKNPEPYRDPVAPPPGDPREDRPLADPQPPGRDLPQG